MSRKYLDKLRVFFTFSAFQKPQTFRRSYCTSDLNTMDAVKTMADLGYAFNSGKQFSLQHSVDVQHLSWFIILLTSILFHYTNNAAGATLTHFKFSEGQLRKVGADGRTTDEPFQFNVSNQHQECQAHYEELGNAVTEYVYHLLETDQNLIRLSVPKDSNKGTFIFVSKDFDQKDVLLILIHGSGAVRAGQWARSLIINDNLDMGTQIPYIKKALDRGYGVMVLNPNDNSLPSGQKILNSGSGEEHTKYVWNTYVKNTKATSIAIVAHSYGGVLTVTLADLLKKEFEKRVKAIAFTDSVHVYSNIKITNYMKEASMNWISSQSPLDTPMNTPEFDIPRVSAGHQKHEMTSYSCMESVFKFIEEKVSKS